MTIIRTALTALTLLLAACAGHDGLYEPACIAYEGDRIELRDGRFEWRRFTDERVVENDGTVAKPFPGFPRSGTYRIDRGRLLLVTDEDQRLDDWFVVVHAKQRYLLTADQHDTFVRSAKLADCALRFTGPDS
ncbi:MAG: hypothetical protein KJO01_06430 [Gammaproteobacteria bacterium]|nr:hypothetical protein [Gammaproteobacteria bacterium]MBT8109669.1 hypothetical protein [Gammaproteobacteria bacterium]NND46489.1 hypothetical protein [Woeseiaceae bacterium]NNL44373.1 hypothetical protein [Woeseiaceae bacterium]